MTEPDEPVAEDDDIDDSPPPDARGGRPTQLTAERVAAFLDEHEAAHGTLPSVRQMQEALGGGRTKLTALRDQVRAERLVAAAAPDGSPVEKALARAVSAALETIGLEAARGAERSIEAARVEADRRVEAAERMQSRADRVEAEAALERERALGRADTLAAELDEVQKERRDAWRDLEVARERERALEATHAALRVEFAERQAATERAEAAVAQLERERDEHAAALERLGTERDTAGRRVADLDTALARAEAERDGAGHRADESVARAERAEAALIDANARVDRLDAKRDDERQRYERAVAALAAARRADVAACHDRIEQLIATLAEAKVTVPETEVPLPTVEFQPGLPLGDGES